MVKIYIYTNKQFLVLFRIYGVPASVVCLLSLCALCTSNVLFSGSWSAWWPSLNSPTVPMSLLCWGAQHWTQHSSITSPVLTENDHLPPPLVILPRMLSNLFATKARAGPWSLYYLLGPPGQTDCSPPSWHSDIEGRVCFLMLKWENCRQAQVKAKYIIKK